MATVRAPVVRVPPDDHLGEAMLAITPSQRAFVIAMLETGGRNASGAAELAGYGDTHPGSKRVAAFRLMRMPLVLAAMREEADRRLRGGALLASSKLVELIDNPDSKIAFKAAVEVLNRAGLIVATQHKLVIEDTRDTDTLRNEVQKMFQRAVAQNALPALEAPVDAEFAEVHDPNDISDLMG